MSKGLKHNVMVEKNVLCLAHTASLKLAWYSVGIGVLLIIVLKYIYQTYWKTATFSDEKVEENLALNLNFHLLEFG